MPQYSPVALTVESATRARELAKHRGKPLGRYVDDLIDAAYAATFGDIDADDIVVEEDEGGRVLGLQLPAGSTMITVSIPAASVESVAASIDRVATKGGVMIDMDLGAMLVISRKGSGVVLEADGGRQSYSTDAAKKLASALRRAATA